MKDLYSFDKDQTSAVITYERVCQAYDKIFKHIGVTYTKGNKIVAQTYVQIVNVVTFIPVEGASGMMGGSQSHEFHYTAEVGDDTLLQCQQCGFGMNKEMSPESVKCPKCSSADIKFTKAIEVGHTFLLGTFYSNALSANYSDADGTLKPPYMGSYGLGVSRIIGASIECLSTQDIIQWPRSLSPFTVCIIPAKEGSIEENVCQNGLLALYNHLTEIFGDDVVVDDRTHMTIGKRFIEAKKLGFPFVVIMGKKMTHNPALYELYESNTKNYDNYELSNLINYFKTMYEQNPSNS